MPALREILAEFGFKVDQRKIDRTDRSIDRLAQGARRLGIAVGAGYLGRGLVRFIGRTIDLGDELDKTSQQLGLTTDELQAFRHAAELAGVDGAAFAQSIGQLQRNAYMAAQGSGEAADAFRDLGVNVRGADGELKSGGQLLADVADGMTGLTNESERTAISMILMGRAGRRMLPLMLQGSEGLEAARQELELLGGGASQQFIESAVELQDNMTRLRISTMSLRSGLAVAVLPVIDRAVRSCTRWASSLATLTRDSEVLRATLVTFGAIAVGVAIKTGAAWMTAVAPVLLAAAAIAVLVLAVEDVIQAWKGERSVLRDVVNGIYFVCGSTRTLTDDINALKGALEGVVQLAREAENALRGFFGVQSRVPEGASAFVRPRVEAAHGWGARARETMAGFWPGFGAAGVGARLLQERIAGPSAVPQPRAVDAHGEYHINVQAGFGRNAPSAQELARTIRREVQQVQAEQNRRTLAVMTQE